MQERLDEWTRVIHQAFGLTPWPGLVERPTHLLYGLQGWLTVKLQAVEGSDQVHWCASSELIPVGQGETPDPIQALKCAQKALVQYQTRRLKELRDALPIQTVPEGVPQFQKGDRVWVVLPNEVARCRIDRVTQKYYHIPWFGRFRRSDLRGSKERARLVMRPMNDLQCLQQARKQLEKPLLQNLANYTCEASTLRERAALSELLGMDIRSAGDLMHEPVLLEATRLLRESPTTLWRWMRILNYPFPLPLADVYSCLAPQGVEVPSLEGAHFGDLYEAET